MPLLDYWSDLFHKAFKVQHFFFILHIYIYIFERTELLLHFEIEQDAHEQKEATHLPPKKPKKPPKQSKINKQKNPKKQQC